MLLEKLNSTILKKITNNNRNKAYAASNDSMGLAFVYPMWLILIIVYKKKFNVVGFII